MTPKTFFTALFVLFYLGVFSQKRVLTGVIKMAGQPVKSLSVYTSFFSTVTDDLGRYNIPLDGCRDCSPGNRLTIFTTGTSVGLGSSEQSCIISTDYRFDFTIDKGRIVINGMVQSSGVDARPLPGILVQIIAGEIDVKPVKTDEFGRFKIPVSIALLVNANSARLQVLDPDKKYKSSRVDPELFDINSFVIIKMEPSRPLEVNVSEFIRTKICVKEFDLVTIEATGQIRVGSMVGTSDPDGRQAGVLGMSLESYNIVSAFNHAALLYRMEGESEWHLAGKRKKFYADRNGCIEFQVNDNMQGDNYGSYAVSVTVQRG